MENVPYVWWEVAFEAKMKRSSWFCRDSSHLLHCLHHPCVCLITNNLVFISTCCAAACSMFTITHLLQALGR